MRNFLLMLKAWVSIRSFTIAVLILVGLSTIFVTVVIMVPVPFQQWFPRVRESVTALGMLAMVFATLLLAYATFRIITSGREQERRNRKERLLNEIIEWATDIQKVSLEVDIPVDGVSLTEEQRRRIEANILLRYGIPYIRNDYIKAIVSEVFKEELQHDVENMIKAFTAFMFFALKSFGVKDKDIKSSFRGTALKTIEEVEQRLKEKTLQELLDKYAEEKSKYATILLIKVGNIMASF